MVQRSSPTSSKAGFTLVELLVVVGIISVLIAILMPTIARARECAQQIKCAANLRAFGQALTIYTQQYGYYPCEMTITQGSGISVWPPILRLNLNGNRQVFLCPSREDRFAWSASPGHNVGPASATYVPYGYDLAELMLDEALTPFSYSYNGGSGTALSRTGLGPVKGIRATNVRQPACMIAITDSWGQGNFDLALQTSLYGLPGSIHSGGCNVLFCDGHVQWMKPDDILMPNVSWQDPRSIPRWRMFVPDFDG